MKAKSRIMILSVFVTIHLSSCTGELKEQDYIKWVRDYDNGLHVQKRANDYVFEVQYAPTDYVWLQYKDRSREELNDLQYYTLTISPSEESIDFIDFKVGSESGKQQKLYYFSYLFQNAIHVEESGVTMPCVLFHFERPVDLKNSRTFVLGFEKSKDESLESTLVIESDQFGSLPISIKVTKENIPALQL
jgi:hypothetical protein